MKKLTIGLCLLALMCIAVCAAAADEATNYLQMNGQIPDQNIYAGGWQAAYGQILNMHSAGIRTYQNQRIEFTMNGADYNAACLPVGLTDLTGDGIPELLFLEAGGESGDRVDLSVYTGDAGSAYCMLFVPGVAWISYPDMDMYKIYLISDGTEKLTVEHYEFELPWTLVFERNTQGRYSLAMSLNAIYDNSGETDGEFYRNGWLVTENEYLADFYGIRSKMTKSITAGMSPDYSTFGLSLTIDEALAQLGAQSVIYVTEAPYYTDPPYTGEQEIWGLTIDRLSTRKGPGTQYEEGGTYNVKGEYVRVLARAYDKRNGIWWVKCVIPYHGEERVLWTGYKRFDHDQLPLDIIPVEEW